jgi:hypothetical protein
MTEHFVVDIDWKSKHSTVHRFPSRDAAGRFIFETVERMLTLESVCDEAEIAPSVLSIGYNSSQKFCKGMEVYVTDHGDGESPGLIWSMKLADTP